uniref:Uncharacterized protein n=1 Tax=Tetradesmus obliquus TaxID=3088 RepID=A0A383VAT9_TETOB|eukprot:jgi/Sobl393_1/3649/SZX62321.1
MMGAARIFADIVTSNLGFLPTALSAASRGPFRLCGRVVDLLRRVLPPTPTPTPPSPSPKPQPSPPPGPNRCLDPDFGTLPKRKAYSFGHPTNTVNAPTTATSPTQLPKACANSNIAITRPDKNCTDALLLALTPAKYSLNSTADTSGSRAFISPAQDQGGCAANVGFVVTAAAEAAVNVYMQQSWSKLNSSEQDFSFCK